MRAPLPWAFWLTASLATAVVAACGSPPPPASPEATPPVASPSAAPTGAAPAPSAAPSGAPTSAPVAPKPPVSLGNNTPIQASKLLDEVRKLGVDTAKPLSAMSVQKKKKLMPFFVKALGYESCTGCHVEGDYEKVTRNIKVTRQMWDHFVVNLRDAQGGALFCDSCHNGKAKSLDRASMEGLQRIMETDYQGKLTRADKKPHDCSTCHGAGPEPKIIEKLWGIAEK
jgi:hypothetical protein